MLPHITSFFLSIMVIGNSQCDVHPLISKCSCLDHIRSWRQRCVWNEAFLLVSICLLTLHRHNPQKIEIASNEIVLVSQATWGPELFAPRSWQFKSHILDSLFTQSLFHLAQWFIQLVQQLAFINTLIRASLSTVFPWRTSLHWAKMNKMAYLFEIGYKEA